ncbi:helix-turn-helix transcriptional regulator [Nostocoides vanveenii]|uniref:Helix-turn-helix transcriptional regulator n=1 Tax=Nostocoides vanveenii TaxID=330835 RepID=A0ABN2KW37_9MICO
MNRNPLGDLGQGLGDYLREQRQAARLSVRQLSELAGVSNPYLSQIERGLKKPSAEILNQLAKGLQVSAESLYVKAGLLDQQDADAPAGPDTRSVIKADVRLTSRQKSTLLDIYDSFVGHPAAAPAEQPTKPAPIRKTTTTTTADPAPAAGTN